MFNRFFEFFHLLSETAKHILLSKATLICKTTHPVLIQPSFTGHGCWCCEEKSLESTSIVSVKWPKGSRGKTLRLQWISRGSVRASCNCISPAAPRPPSPQSLVFCRRGIITQLIIIPLLLGQETAIRGDAADSEPRGMPILFPILKKNQQYR